MDIFYVSLLFGYFLHNAKYHLQQRNKYLRKSVCIVYCSVYLPRYNLKLTTSTTIPSNLTPCLSASFVFFITWENFERLVFSNFCTMQIADSRLVYTVANLAEFRSIKKTMHKIPKKMSENTYSKRYRKFWEAFHRDCKYQCIFQNNLVYCIYQGLSNIIENSQILLRQCITNELCWKMCLILLVLHIVLL